jgi:hypothetical protein
VRNISRPIPVSTRSAPEWEAELAAAILKLFLSLSFMFATACAVQAQGITASAQISGQPAGGGSYNYTLTLGNANSSLSSISTFWYSWSPGADFLPSSPKSVQTPAGWAYSIQGGPYYDYYGYYYPDGYSIKFTTATTPLAPGSSLNFGFISPDSPAALAGNSPWYPGYKVGTSYVYSGVGSGNSSLFTVQSVPEPSLLGLLVAGSAGLLTGRRRSRPA